MDFIKRRGLPPLTLVLMLVGAGGVAQSLMERQQLLDARDQVMFLSHRLERQAKMQHLQSHATQALADPKAELAVRQVARELTLPWEDLLNALQEADNPSIALQKIQPDNEAGGVTLNGHAAHIDALLQYLARLEKNPHWRQIQLLREEVETTPSDKPLSFSISAHWSAS